MKLDGAIRMQGFSSERILKMMRATFRTVIAAGLLLMCAPAFAQVRIAWATEDLGSYNPAPPAALQAPDGKVSGISDSAYIYIRNFSAEQKYDGLAQLLGLRNDEELNRWDFIAFEGNQNMTPGKGWESSIWFITDQVRAVAGAFDENTASNASGTSPLRFMSGTLRAADYVKFFGIKEFKTGDPPADKNVEFASWILIDVPDEININAPQFRIWVSGALIGNGKSPDPDAFGVIRRTTR